MSYSAAARDQPSLGWMLLRSSWMLVTLVPGALVSWVGLLLVGIVGRMPRWTAIGVALGAATLLAHTPLLGQWRPVGLVVVYIGGMLLALAANPGWLRALWSRQATPPQSARTATRSRASSSRSTTSSSTARRSRTGSSPRSQALAARSKEESPAAEAVGASSRSYFAETAAAKKRDEPIDVNTASNNALTSLSGISRNKARDLNKRRDAMGGWPSLEAFAAAAALQPHELMRLRDEATCTPPKRAARGFGRRIDF